MATRGEGRGRWERLLYATALVLLGILWQPARAIEIELDASLDVWPVVADSSLIVLKRSVSWEAKQDLIGVDAATGKDRWRIAIDDESTCAFTDDAESFAYIQGDELVCRSKADGQVVWNVDLRSLEWPKAYPIRQNGHSVSTGGPPEFFKFAMPLANSRFLFVMRLGMTGGGCCRMTCTRDWMLLDRATREKMFAGQGEFLTATRDSVLVKAYFDENLWLITAAGSTDVVERVRKGLKQGRVYTSPWFWAMAPKRWASRYCTFRMREVRKSLRFGDKFDERVIFDTQKSEVHHIRLREEDEYGYQVEWANTERCVVAYAETDRSDSASNPKSVAPRPLWIDVYSINGVRKRRLTVPPPSDKAQWGWMSFAGETQDGHLAFFARTYSRRTDGTDISPTSYVSALVVDPRSLRIARTVSLMDGQRGSANLRLFADADQVVQVFGNVGLQHMASDQIDHTLTVRAVDLKDGRELWRRDEKVTIYKKPEPAR